MAETTERPNPTSEPVNANPSSTGDYLGPPPTGVQRPSTVTSAPAVSPADSRRGRFTIIRDHAQGGLGKVSLARDEKLKRNVALKEIRPDRLGDTNLRARFVTEAEITGTLEHPGIVPVYAMDDDPTGEPYYAMRFIEGKTLAVRIREFHDERRRLGATTFVSTAFRHLLQSFVVVCNTIAYAHSKGVIHRDLKPANVMLGDFGETLVLDWGLAKWVGTPAGRDQSPGDRKGTTDQVEPTTDHGQLTVAGQVLGTAPYLSPEQARGAETGPSTDVYALGAILYELLTGQAPYAGRIAIEVIQLVRAQPPALPSSVQKNVPRALEAICMKAMSRTPLDRYSTATDLAGDVDRWMADEAVSAYVEPWTATAGRWARKRRTLVTSAAALLLAAVPLSTALAVLSDRARQQAEADTVEIGKQKDIAEGALNFVVNRVFATARPKGQEGGLGHDVKLADAVRAALPYVDEHFKDQPLVEARLRMALGLSFAFLGGHEEAIAQHQRALDLLIEHRGRQHRNTLGAMNNLGSSLFSLGRYAEALEHYAEARRLAESSLGADHSDTLTYVNNVANCYAALGRVDEALELYEKTLAGRRATLGPNHPETLQSMHSVARANYDFRRYAPALKLLDETLVLRKAELGPDHPETLQTLLALGSCYYAMGQFAVAAKTYEDTLPALTAQLGPSHADTLKCMASLAQCYGVLRRFGDARSLYEKTLRLQQEVLGDEHHDTLETMAGFAHFHTAQGKHADALSLYQTVLPLQRKKLGTEHATTLQTSARLASTYYALRRREEALQLAEETLSLMQRTFGNDNSETLACKSTVANSLYVLGRHAEAAKHYAELLALKEANSGLDHADTLTAMSNLSLNYAALGRHDDALKLRQRMLGLWEGRVGPNAPQTLQTMKQVAESFLQLERGDEAVAVIDECVLRATGKSVDPSLISRPLELRLRHFAKHKNAAECRRTAETWENLNLPDAVSLYNAACFRAVSAAVSRQESATQGDDADRRASAEADLAMERLQKAIVAGFANAELVKTSKDLDVLRERADFQKLLAEFERKNK